MLTPGDRRRIQSLAEHCARLRRSIEALRLREKPRPVIVDRYDSALARLGRDDD